jgi:hypothetical protein
VASLRRIAGCIGLPARISVLNDFYGMLNRPRRPLSLLQQLRLLQGPHVHLNLIRVGIESFTAGDEAQIDRALQQTRAIYATVGLGVGRVVRYLIGTADARGREHIESTNEARSLADEWTVPDDAVDVFLVLTFAGITGGFSPIPGSCDKNRKGESGAVAAIDTGPFLGIALAHEVAHYLGLDHVRNPANLMFGDGLPGVSLTTSQGATMRRHCFVKPGC